MRRLALPAVASSAVILFALAGCAGSPPDSRATATVTATVTATPSAGADVLSGFLCAADDGGVWRGKALLTNVGAATNTYTVRFSVVGGPNADVHGMKQDTFTLAAGDSVDVAFAGIYTGEQRGLRCVPHVTAQPSG